MYQPSKQWGKHWSQLIPNFHTRLQLITNPAWQSALMISCQMCPYAFDAPHGKCVKVEEFSNSSASKVEIPATKQLRYVYQLQWVKSQLKKHKRVLIPQNEQTTTESLSSKMTSANGREAPLIWPWWRGTHHPPYAMVLNPTIGLPIEDGLYHGLVKGFTHVWDNRKGLFC